MLAQRVVSSTSKNLRMRENTFGDFSTNFHPLFSSKFSFTINELHPKQVRIRTSDRGITLSSEYSSDLTALTSLRREADIDGVERGGRVEGRRGGFNSFDEGGKDGDCDMPVEEASSSAEESD